MRWPTRDTAWSFACAQAAIFQRKYKVFMITFSWDPAKARANLRKHGISFEEARTVFLDDFAAQFFDDDNADAEERFLMLGMSSEANLLLVCHCERQAGTEIRIISARRATRNESAHYGGPRS